MPASRTPWAIPASCSSLCRDCDGWVPTWSWRLRQPKLWHFLKALGRRQKRVFVRVTCVVSRHSQARQSSRSASAVPWPRGDSLRFSRVRLPARLWEVAPAAATAPMASAVRAGFFDTSQLPKFRRGKNLERHEGGKSTAGKLPLLTSHCPGAVSSCGCCKDE